MNDWVRGLGAEVMITDTNGIILEMNREAASIFAEDGGENLLGTNVLACHPEAARTKLSGMMEKQASNGYYNTEEDEKRFFFQSPWFPEMRIWSSQGLPFSSTGH